MKILFVSGEGDYDTMDFADSRSGKKASELIEYVEGGGMIYVEQEDEDEDDVVLEAKVIEVGAVDKRFIDFIRDSIQDYDDTKVRNFWFENETI